MRDPENALAGWQQRVEQQTALTLELSRRIESTCASAESRGGEVTVTVDSSGGLADLKFGNGAERIALDRLAKLILQASRQAQARLAENMSDLVTDVWGAGSETARLVSSAYTERFRARHDDEDGERP